MNYNEMDEFDRRRAERRARMNQRVRRRQQTQKLAVAVLGVVALVVLIVVINVFVKDKDKNNEKDNSSQDVVSTIDNSESDENKDDEGDVQDDSDEADKGYYAEITENTTMEFPDVTCEYAVLIDKESNTIVAQRNYKERINPASMTKVLTVLVAAEHVKNITDVCTVTLETTDYCYVNDCSNAGYEVGEEITVEDLFYGTILPSGADAALTLANYVAGSHENFVKMMNDKIAELGLSETTHFTNCVGLYAEDHYTTVYDMALILEAAMDNEFCRKVLSTHIYKNKATNKHPDGQSLSNLFLRRVEDQSELGEITVLGAKTGFVTEAGNCCVSSAVTPDGKEYYLCTAKSAGSWPCIYDHAKIYGYFLNKGNNANGVNDANNENGSDNATDTNVADVDEDTRD